VPPLLGAGAEVVGVAAVPDAVSPVVVGATVVVSEEDGLVGS
jgi:hypothetical protein